MMAGYLPSITWVFLLALFFTPTPARSEDFGRFRSSATPAHEPEYAFEIGGVDATRPNSGAIIHNPYSNYRPPVLFGPRPRPRPTWYYNQYNQHQIRPYWYYSG
ncbi:uncharacterized protein LOC121879343 [Homarus americanus]|nr:uncharacterized protein LOC121879343 [Homarus americanus]